MMNVTIIDCPKKYDRICNFNTDNFTPDIAFSIEHCRINCLFIEYAK